MSPTIEEPNFDPNYRKYNTAFNYLMVSLVLFAICILAIFGKVSEWVSPNVADFLIVISFVFIFGFSLAGFIIAIRSFFHNEENHYKKWVGFFGNLFFVFLFFIGMLSNFFTFFDFMNS